MEETGCIDLEYPFVMSWLWEKPNNTVIMSMVIVDEKECRKGHCTNLVLELKKKYNRIIVFNPSTKLLSIIKKHGFSHTSNIDDEGYNGWIWKHD